MKKILGIIAILIAVVIGTYLLVMTNISITAIDGENVQIECFGNIWEYIIMQ
jgi:uncharacterized protein YxeA